MAHNISLIVAKNIFIEALRRSILPMPVVCVINATNNVVQLDYYQLLSKIVNEILTERMDVLKKLCKEYGINSHSLLNSDHIAPKKEQKIRFFVNILEVNEKKCIGKIVYSRKYPGMNRFKVARQSDNGAHVILDYHPLPEKIRIFSVNGFYSAISRDIIHHFLKNDAENLLKLWREHGLLQDE